MIQANELRVGNWYLDELGKAWQVEGMDFTTCVFSDCAPIPLTSEIFGKCGFENNELKITGNVGNVFLRLNNNTVSLWVEGYYKFGNATSLHQLQNLYFALTGTELTYTP